MVAEIIPEFHFQKSHLLSTISNFRIVFQFHQFQFPTRFSNFNSSNFRKGFQFQQFQFPKSFPISAVPISGKISNFSSSNFRRAFHFNSSTFRLHFPLDSVYSNFQLPRESISTLHSWCISGFPRERALLQEVYIRARLRKEPPTV